MICPVCGGDSPENSNFCSHCATPFSQEAAAPEVLPAPRKGRLWVPFVILACMMAVGLAVFFHTLVPKKVVSGNAPWFSVQGGVLSFDAALYTGGEILAVPAEIGGRSVTALKDGCFADCDMLTTVLLPNSLKSISPGAFQGCDALRGIFIPEGVTAIGSGAFANCQSLEAVCILSHVTEIGSGAFFGCEKLSYIFYTGTGSAWRELYKEDISHRTRVIASDEMFMHPGASGK